MGYSPKRKNLDEAGSNPKLTMQQNFHHPDDHEYIKRVS